MHGLGRAWVVSEGIFESADSVYIRVNQFAITGGYTYREVNHGNFRVKNMKIGVLVVLIAALSGCNSPGPLEDRDRGREFSELEAQSKAMRKEMHAARRDALRQSRKQ